MVLYRFSKLNGLIRSCLIVTNKLNLVRNLLSQMMDPEDLNDLFTKQTVGINRVEIRKYLTCPLCSGLFRFAHTILQCGHTFCKFCIFNYVRSFKGKNPEVKCPQCHEAIDSYYRKSIVKDTYKQSLVDHMEPRFHQEQNLVVKRVEELFPECNISFLLDEFTNDILLRNQPYGYRNKKNTNNNSARLLPELVREKLEISFDQFVQKIYDESSFQGFKTKVLAYQHENKVVVQVNPRTEKDYQALEFRNQAKMPNNLDKLRKYLEKMFYERIQKNKKVPIEFVKSKNETRELKVVLWVGQYQVKPQEGLQDLKRKFGEVVLEYQLKYV